MKLVAPQYAQEFFGTILLEYGNNAADQLREFSFWLGYEGEVEASKLVLE